MKYQPPYGNSDPNASYINGNPANGVEGSIPPASMMEYPQRELIAAMLVSNLTPSDSTFAQLAQAISIGTFVGVFGGTANALTATVPGGVGFDALQAGMVISGFVGASPNTGAVTLAVSGFTAAPGQKPVVRKDGGSALQGGDLAAFSLVAFRYDGASFRLVGLAISDIVALLQTSTSPLAVLVKVRLQVDTTFYVDTALGSDGNDGLAPGTGRAWQTVQHALDTIAGNYDLNGHNAFIQLADGAYASAIQRRPWVGGGTYNVTVNGNATSPGNVIISNSNASNYGALGASGTGAGFCYQNLELVNTASAATGSMGCIYVDGNALVVMTGPVIFGAGTSAQIYATNGGRHVVASGFAVNASAPYPFFAPSGGQIIFSPVNINVTFNGTLTNSATALVTDLGAIEFSTQTHFTVNGSVSNTVARFSATGNAIIDTAGQGPSWLPGSIPGDSRGLSSGGQYI